jgi:hypothetical protein
MSDQDDITEDELVQRVVYALLRPAVRMAAMWDMPLKVLAELLQSAHFQELRSHGLTIEETSASLGVSRRTALRMSKQLRDRFVLPDLRHNLPRRIEFMLAVRPMSATKVRQVLTDEDDAAVDAAIGTLLSEGRLEELSGRTPVLRPAPGLRRLARDTWLQRIGGLTSFSENFADAAYGRFFATEPKSFARTLSFQIPAGAHASLEAVYQDLILPELTRLSDDAEGASDADSMQLSLCWAPYEFMSAQRRA